LNIDKIKKSLNKNKTNNEDEINLFDSIEEANNETTKVLEKSF
jgi:hypothetical protein